ncbi:28S ribosomal protein S31, mitochondrial isoform X2 [Alligator sinensis]|uniref:Small ribosomal subunit protein mS31 n=1 Tax=Alligator sinensis TaxID=38654 RepID=A0A1U7RTV5_ALLSI|nr:28S ribosomal protein S31, mitochondrial isoform X1 [Alligator sinensis]XP_025062421.1 28S ribosomal protein S31, mitochondrial isoform X2 [Alligator sinensis]
MWRRVCALWRLAVVCRPLHLCPHPPRSKIQKCFSSSAGFCNRKDGSTISADSTTEKASENQKKATKETKREDLLNILHGKKTERSIKKTVMFKNKLQVMEGTKSPLEHMKSTRKIILEGEEHKKVARGKLVSPALVKAASVIASSLPRNRKQTRSDLLSQLRKHHEITRSQQSGKASNVRSVPYKGMKLNIFQVAPRVTEGVSETESSPTLWDLEYAKEIAAVQQQPPMNGFEELIQWTKEGKLWEFPINNEAGIEDDVEFYEHIFLDKYLEDFPKRGPIRHFMELVTCGLSKNPYLTVKQKVEHIEWFQNYFKEKEELLKEIENYEKETELSLEKKTLLK